jgi:hypothetical protein
MTLAAVGIVPKARRPGQLRFREAGQVHGA